MFEGLFNIFALYFTYIAFQIRREGVFGFKVDINFARILSYQGYFKNNNSADVYLVRVKASSN